MDKDWFNIRWQLASSAMQGVLESGKLGEFLELDPHLVAIQSLRLADALIEELKKTSD